VDYLNKFPLAPVTAGREKIFWNWKFLGILFYGICLFLERKGSKRTGSALLGVWCLKFLRKTLFEPFSQKKHHKGGSRLPPSFENSCANSQSPPKLRLFGLFLFGRIHETRPKNVLGFRRF